MVLLYLDWSISSAMNATSAPTSGSCITGTLRPCLRARITGVVVGRFVIVGLVPAISIGGCNRGKTRCGLPRVLPQLPDSLPHPKAGNSFCQRRDSSIRAEYLRDWAACDQAAMVARVAADCGAAAVE